MERIPVWIDTDCGVDDAMALLCAFRLPELDIVGHGLDAAQDVIKLVGMVNEGRASAMSHDWRERAPYVDVDAPYALGERRFA